MAEHSVFGSSPPPWPLSGFDNGGPIVTANAFYSTATTWWVVGGRLYVPAGAPLPEQVTLGLRTAAYETLVDLSTALVASGVADVAEGWVEARWAPVELAPVTVAWISADAVSGYVFGEPPDPGFTQASDGADLYLAESGIQGRAAYRIGSDITTRTAAHYGLDILVTDDPDAGTVHEVSGLVPASSAALGSVTARRGVDGAAAAVAGAAGAVTARRRVAGMVLATSGAFGAVTVAGALPPLPDSGTLIPLTPGRGMSDTTPRRGMEAL
ncbi:hypothetical protein ACFQHV_00915 [Promicromonospora thailandica]|uniref:Uncharacterized protein n=1 Tax=Promicromonospora thailandica TaxID=765201 RepID=A0A9X2G1Z6_9MICO|nr:hypothetical protein [Promicromonospora thailandica]MCP2265585.1 hypothetical protein [Promicromonospora thailandica]BFF17146.1 hypothetical protein GCM10025730_06670 [Promicromonospora thailandica]